MNANELFCTHCGELLPKLGADAIACPMCGSDLPTIEATTHETDSRETVAVSASSESKSLRPRLSPRAMAGLLSLLLPGAGQVYNGHLLRGVFVLSTFWLIVPWILGVIDAVVSAPREHSPVPAPAQA